MANSPSSAGAINRNLHYRPLEEPGFEARRDALLAGDRAALSRAITLLESRREADRTLAAELVSWADEQSGRHSFRLGISGSPGVGKSTFIEAFGMALVERGHKLAVLAIDPSSSLSGGSILGDKTRMEQLVKQPNAYIRPSPNQGALGGVNRSTRESLMLCEAAGFDFVIVETVGVGQSELAVHGMTDAFLLLAQPGAGDELQGIKRGVLELADMIVVNKLDVLPQAVRQTAAQLRQALHLAPARADGWTRPILTAAALTGQQIDEIVTSVEDYRQHLLDGSYFAQGRERQRQKWLGELIQSELLYDLKQANLTDRETTPEPGKVFARAKELLQSFYQTQDKQPPS
ncbi:MAG: methylmalonyl Co-A mutase-associated GTPase MeaB [Bacteroidota bacterium]